MEHAHCTTTIREPWNKGALVAQKAPSKLKKIRAIRVRLQLASRHRDLALFNPAIDNKLLRARRSRQLLEAEHVVGEHVRLSLGYRHAHCCRGHLDMAPVIDRPGTVTARLDYAR